MNLDQRTALIAAISSGLMALNDIHWVSQGENDVVAQAINVLTLKLQELTTNVIV